MPCFFLVTVTAVAHQTLHGAHSLSTMSWETPWSQAASPCLKGMYQEAA